MKSDLTRQSVESRFSMIQSLGVPVIILDLEGRITHFNRAAEVYSGYRSSEVLGQKPWEFLISESDAQVLKQAFQNLKSTGLQTEMEANWCTRDGKSRTFHWSNSPVLDQSGRIKWIVDVFLDVTDEKESEIQLKNAKMEVDVERQIAQFLAESAYRMSSSKLNLKSRVELFVSLSVPIVSDWSICIFKQRHTGSYVRAGYHWDPTRAPLISLAEKELTDEKVTELISELHLGSSMKSLIERVYLYRAETWDQLGWNDRNIFSMCNHQTDSHGLFLIASGKMKDTPLRNNWRVAEEYVRRLTLLIEQADLYDEAVRAVQLRDRFISMASHELRTPLTTLKMQSDLIMKLFESRPNELEKIQYLFNKSGKELTRMGRMVADMLDTAYISQGKFKIIPSLVDLNSLVRELVGELAEIATVPQVDLRVEEHGSVMGHWDRNRIAQVFTNIILNAIKFGKGHPVTVRLGKRNMIAFVEIEDEGPGIGKENLSQIFECYVQAAPPEVGGLGLGLFIAQQLVMAHQGKISVESELGKGAKFIIELPMGSGK